MSDTLIIRFQQTDIEPTSLVQWLLFDEFHQFLGGTFTEFSQIATEVGKHSESFRVYVIVAAEEVLIRPTRIPAKQMRQVKQALPFMVEEFLAQEIEAVHMAVPAPLDLTRGIIDVVIVSHKILINWLDMLHSHNLSPAGITVDSLCIPRDEASWSFIIDQQRLLIKTGDNLGIACEIGDIEMIMSALVHQWEAEAESAESIRPSINLIECGGESGRVDLMEKISEYIHSDFPEFEVKAKRYEESSDEVLAVQYSKEASNTVNILQGGYRVSARSENGIPQWGLAASIAGLGLVAYLILTLASGIYFKQQTEKINSDVITLYKTIFPNERRVVSPKKQMQSHLNQLSGGGHQHLGGSFLPLLEQLAKPFGSTQSTGQLAVQQLRYDQSRNNLQLEIQSRSIEQLNQLKKTLVDSGLKVDINSAAEDGNKVLARLVVGDS